MTIFEAGLRNVVAIHEQMEEEKSKEQHMGDYIASMKALEEAMEPYKEQKRELKANYLENGWLTKEGHLELNDILSSVHTMPESELLEHCRRESEELEKTMVCAQQ